MICPRTWPSPGSALEPWTLKKSTARVGSTAAIGTSTVWAAPLLPAAIVAVPLWSERTPRPPVGNQVSEPWIGAVVAIGAQLGRPSPVPSEMTRPAFDEV